jgi:hypothetical protein
VVVSVDTYKYRDNTLVRSGVRAYKILSNSLFISRPKILLRKVEILAASYTKKEASGGGVGCAVSYFKGLELLNSSVEDLDEIRFIVGLLSEAFHT